MTYHQDAALVQHQFVLRLLYIHHGLILRVLRVDRAWHCGIGDEGDSRDAFASIGSELGLVGGKWGGVVVSLQIILQQIHWDYVSRLKQSQTEGIRATCRSDIDFGDWNCRKKKKVGYR